MRLPARHRLSIWGGQHTPRPWLVATWGDGIAPPSKPMSAPKTLFIFAQKRQTRGREGTYLSSSSSCASYRKTKNNLQRPRQHQTLAKRPMRTLQQCSSSTGPLTRNAECAVENKKKPSLTQCGDFFSQTGQDTCTTTDEMGGATTGPWDVSA